MLSGASPVLVPREDPVGKIVFAVFALVFGIVFFVGLITFLSAVFSRNTDRTRDAIDDHPMGAMVLGLAAYGVTGVLAAWLYSMAVVRRLLETEIVWSMLIAAVAVAVVPLAASLLGAPGAFGCVGDRLALRNDGAMSGVRRIVVGTVVCVLAALFPVIGWFIVLPALLAVSAGGLVLGRFQL